MSDVRWDRFCKENGDKAYELCKPLPQVKDYAVEAKKDGAILYVLTTSGSKEETQAKRIFVETHYKGLFDDIYAVEHDSEKVPFVMQKASELGISLSECELVEDTYRILLEAVTVGIGVMHVSNLFSRR